MHHNGVKTSLINVERVVIVGRRKNVLKCLFGSVPISVSGRESAT